MEVQPEFPIFVVAEGPFPLLFAAGTQAELDAYLQEHAGLTPAPEGGITSRFFDPTGRLWSLEGGGSSGGALVPTEDSVSQQDLQDIVTRGYAELARDVLESGGSGEFHLESRDFRTLVAAYLAYDWDSTLPPPPPNPGSARHRRWHASRGIPIRASH
jgi:hypothetical protein